MIWIVIVAVIVLIILFKIGIFRKPGECKECGKAIKGTEQVVFDGHEKMILCKDCAAKIHPQIMQYAKDNWDYVEYTDYLLWEKETEAERAKFNPDEQYGGNKALMIDTERGLFSIGKSKIFKDNESGIVLRFTDLIGYDINFEPEKVKEGVLTDRVQGREYVKVDMHRPNVKLDEVLSYSASYPLKKKGILRSRYEYQFSEKFLNIIDTFVVGMFMDEMRRDGENVDSKQEMDRIMKALELFKFDSLADATKENLRTQRNALVKEFRPGGDEDNATYVQRINDAFDLLSKVAEDQEDIIRL